MLDLIKKEGFFIMKKGYNLTEATVVLAMIGVLSMLTVPSFINNSRSMANISRLQKAYKSLSDAVGSWMVDAKISIITDSDIIVTNPSSFLSEYLKCADVSNSSTVRFLAKRNQYNDKMTSKIFKIGFTDAYGCATLQSGASVCISKESSKNFINIERPFGNIDPNLYLDIGLFGQRPVAEVIVDTNGPNVPNTLGDDLFTFYVYSDGFVGVKLNTVSNNASYKDKCSRDFHFNCFKMLVDNDWKKL